MSVSVSDIHWMAGLLEGEGAFMLRLNGRMSPMIYLGMTDEDVVARAARLVGGAIYSKEVGRKAHYKTQYILKIHGAAAAGWMMTLYPLLGQRRRDRIRKVLAVWRTVVPLGHAHPHAVWARAAR